MNCADIKCPQDSCLRMRVGTSGTLVGTGTGIVRRRVWWWCPNKLLKSENWVIYFIFKTYTYITYQTFNYKMNDLLKELVHGINLEEETMWLSKVLKW